MPRRPRGQAIPWLVTGAAAFLLLVATLARYRSREGGARPAVGPVYLGDERASIPATRRGAAPGPAQGPGARAAKAGLPLRTYGGGERSLSFAGASRIFGARGLAGTDAEAAQGLVASEAVLVRSFGRPDGDWIYHRVHGWMRFDGDRWVPVRAADLPASLLADFPELAPRGAPGRLGAGPGGSGLAPRGSATGSDGEPLLPAWLAKARPPEELE